MSKTQVWLGSAVLVLAFVGVPVRSGESLRGAEGQLANPIAPASRGAQTGTRTDNQSPVTRDAEAKQVRARNDDRQKRLEADSDKLLALATQLHEDVSKTDKNVLSMDVIRRAQEIEKLAHDVKERMKG